MFSTKGSNLSPVIVNKRHSIPLSLDTHFRCRSFSITCIDVQCGGDDSSNPLVFYLFIFFKELPKIYFSHLLRIFWECEVSRLFNSLSPSHDFLLMSLITDLFPHSLSPTTVTSIDNVRIRMSVWHCYSCRVHLLQMSHKHDVLFSGGVFLDVKFSSCFPNVRTYIFIFFTPILLLV